MSDEIDRDVSDVIAADRRRGRKSKPARAEKSRDLNRLGHDALIAIQHGNEREFAAILGKAKILDGSPEWIRAWKIFRSGGLS